MFNNRARVGVVLFVWVRIGICQIRDSSLGVNELPVSNLV